MTRILIATPIFPPAIGGPAVYAENLAQQLAGDGFEVAILSYGDPKTSREVKGLKVHIVSSRFPAGLRHLVYFFKAVKLAAASKAVLVFDPFAVGVPVALACRRLKKPMLLRVEGDYLWETYVNRTREDITLESFYRKRGSLKLSLKEKIIYRLSRRVFSQAVYLVFSSEWRKRIFGLGYGLRPEQSAIASPVWPQVEGGREVREKVLLFAGRFIKVKNLIRLIYAFLDAGERSFCLELIGSGPDEEKIRRTIADAGAGSRIVVRPPLDREELAVKIASVHAFLLPSLSDVSPNVILECLKTATPFILTRESGFYETLKDIGLFVDPLDDRDIRGKIRGLFDPQAYAAYRRRLAGFSVRTSWPEITRRWSELISKT